MSRGGEAALSSTGMCAASGPVARGGTGAWWWWCVQLARALVWVDMGQCTARTHAQRYRWCSRQQLHQEERAEESGDGWQREEAERWAAVFYGTCAVVRVPQWPTACAVFVLFQGIHKDQTVCMCDCVSAVSLHYRIAVVALCGACGVALARLPVSCTLSSRLSMLRVRGQQGQALRW